jgi:hypothetical protein
MDGTETYVVVDESGSELAAFEGRDEAIEALVTARDDGSEEDGVILVYVGPEVVDSIDYGQALEEAEQV